MKIRITDSLCGVPVGTILPVIVTEKSTWWVYYEGKEHMVAPWEGVVIDNMKSETRLLAKIEELETLKEAAINLATISENQYLVRNAHVWQRSLEARINLLKWVLQPDEHEINKSKPLSLKIGGGTEN